MDSQRRFVNQLGPGETVDQVFLVRDKNLRTTKTGDYYIVCTLCDRTGSVSARMWQATEAVFSGIPTEGFLHVKGRTEDYRGTLQMVIEACRPYSADKVELADYLATTACDVEEMWAELLEILRGVKNKHLRLLIKNFVSDKEFVAAYKRAPAAMSLHNPFIGGLLEHTLMIARSTKALLPLYPQLNADLLLTGVFLHDAGKMAELSTGLAISYTDRGQLVGHITIAAIWVAERAAAVAAETGEPFPQRIVDLLQHLILSHHGVYEYGSPKLPAIPEAFFLHYLDNLDAKMYMTTHAISSDADADNNFTPYLRELETRIYKRSDDLAATDDAAADGDAAEGLFG